MTDDQLERLLHTLDSISGSFKSIARTLELDYQRRYPIKTPTEPTVTYVPSEQQKIIEDQQGDEADRNAPIADWSTLGPREREWIRKDSQTDVDGTENR